METLLCIPIRSMLGEDTTGDISPDVSVFTGNNHMNKDEYWKVVLDLLIISAEGIDSKGSGQLV